MHETIVAKSLKKSGQLVDFDPENRDCETGYFVVVRRPDELVLLVIDESGLRSHLSLVAKLRELEVLPHMPGKILPQEIVECIRGGTYLKNWDELSRLRGNWSIYMSSGDYGVVWEDLQHQVVEIISGGKQWEKGSET